MNHQGETIVEKASGATVEYLRSDGSALAAHDQVSAVALARLVANPRAPIFTEQRRLV